MRDSKTQALCKFLDGIKAKYLGKKYSAGMAEQIIFEVNAWLDLYNYPGHRISGVLFDDRGVMRFDLSRHPVDMHLDELFPPTRAEVKADCDKFFAGLPKCL